MITANEKQRLMEQHRQDPHATQAAGLKCAAGLAVLALIAVIGVQSGQSDSAGEEARAAAANQPRVSASVADAQKTMEERRERFGRSAPPSGAIAASLASGHTMSTEPQVQAVDEVTMLRRAND